MRDLWVWLLLLWPLALGRRPEAGCSIWARRSVLVLLTVLMLRYLHWRLTASLNLATPLSSSLSWLMLVAEAWLLLSGLAPLLLSWRRFDDGRADADAAQAAWQASTWRPQVDVLVPTCGEPLAVLERCLIGCTGLTYPHTTVWVLDDSQRPAVQDLAARHGCRYLSRPERHGAKAGNLNAGLAASSGELVVVFDADFVPQHQFLERTIGLLADPRTALVQTPQVFFNADPLMRNLAMERWLLPDEDHFYRWIEPVRSAWGAVVCAGTAFVARRRALEQVGGFNTAALSEDLVTGIALLGTGWRLRYLGEPLSAGLAAETLLDFVRQRQRWAGGTLQSLRLAHGPLRQSGLGLGQRLALLEGCLHWLTPLPRLLLLLMPLAYGWLGVAPILVSGPGLLGQLLPLWAGLLLSVGWLSRRSRYAVLGELPSWVLTVPLASTALASLLGRFSRFRITPKQQPRQHGGASALLVGPLLALWALQLGNLGALVLELATSPAPNHASLALGLLWSLLTVLGLLVALRACWDRANPQPLPWLAPGGEVQLRQAGGSVEHAQLEAISEAGADLLLSREAQRTLGLEAGAQVMVTLAASGVPPLAARCEGVWPCRDGISRLSLHWHALPPEALAALQRWMFGRDGCWRQRPARSEPKALLALLAKVLKPPRALAAGSRSLVTQACESEIGDASLQHERG